MFRSYYKIIIWLLVIAYLCFAPSDGFKKVNIPIPHIDKFVHFIMFYILGVFLQAATFQNLKTRNTLFIAFLIYGLLIEIIQHYMIASRNGDVIDFLFDSLGLIVGIFSFIFYPKFIRGLL
jgi:VanZ family protein